MQRNRENFCLEVVNIFNLVISVGLLVCYVCLGDVYYNLIDAISTGLEMIYLAIWSYALYSLFVRFKASEHLLPRKRVFVIHATLLTFFLLCQTICEVTAHILNGNNCLATCFDIIASIHNISLTL